MLPTLACQLSVQLRRPPQLLPEMGPHRLEQPDPIHNQPPITLTPHPTQVPSCSGDPPFWTILPHGRPRSPPELMPHTRPPHWGHPPQPTWALPPCTDTLPTRCGPRLHVTGSALGLCPQARPPAHRNPPRLLGSQAVLKAVSPLGTEFSHQLL